MKSPKDKSASKRKLTDAEHHARFVDMAKEVGASNDPKAFAKAFAKVVSSTSSSRRARERSS